MSRPYWIIAGLLTLTAWALAAWLYPSLPQRVPTHWNIEGKVDGWGDKSWATFLMPGMMIAFLILFAFLPALSPKHFEVDSFRSTYLYIMVLITGLFAYMNGVILLATWQEVRGSKVVEQYHEEAKGLLGLGPVSGAAVAGLSPARGECDAGVQSSGLARVAAAPGASPLGPTTAFFPLVRIDVGCHCRRYIARSATGSGSKRPRSCCCVNS